MAAIVGATTRVSALSADGSRVATREGSTTGFLIPDLHGNVAAAEQSGSATIAVALRYDGYGQTLGSPYTGTGAIAMDARYQGRLDLSATSDPLYDMRARFYAPGLGTFTQLDSVLGSAQNPLSMNRFLYAEANPATFIDPTGHFVSEGDSTPGSQCSYIGDWGCGKTAATSKSKVRAATRKTKYTLPTRADPGKGATRGDPGEKKTAWQPPSLETWLNFSDDQRGHYIGAYWRDAASWMGWGDNDESFLAYWILAAGTGGAGMKPLDAVINVQRMVRLQNEVGNSPNGTLDTWTATMSLVGLTGWGLPVGGASAHAFEDLANLRAGQGLPKAGDPNDSSTRSRLDVGGRSFYGQNAPETVRERPQGVTFQTMRHAEGDSFGQAREAGIRGGTADLYVDRVPCSYCRASMAGLARSVELDELRVWTEGGLFGTYTASTDKFMTSR